MTSSPKAIHQHLGTLSNLHQMMAQLVRDLPGDQVNKAFHPHLPSIGWLFGRSVYLETHWIRGIISGDDDLADRVRHIFGTDDAEITDRDRQLPPKDHLLNWAAEIQDEHLSLLANPGQLPDHPLLLEGFLPGYLTQVEGMIYEQMLAVLTARTIKEDAGNFQVKAPLVAATPGVTETAEIQLGHYRIGARDGLSFDNEHPIQMVKLSSFRICQQPVSNAQYLAFLEATREQAESRPPWHWKRNAQGHYYGIGLNGPFDLLPDEPVQGLSQQEAKGLADWAAGHIEGLQGAVLQHEYQWEVAARGQQILNTGRVWEWCSNRFEPYDLYQPPEDRELATRDLDGSLTSLRGGCLHTQPGLRRASLRIGALATEQMLFAGARLVLPPST